MYIMDYMEQSTIHIKAPHNVHIAAKVIAAHAGVSMNQLIVDLIKERMDKDGVDTNSVDTGIRMARKYKSFSEPRPLTEVLDELPELPADTIEDEYERHQQEIMNTLTIDPSLPNRAVDADGQGYKVKIVSGKIVELL